MTVRERVGDFQQGEDQGSGFRQEIESEFDDPGQVSGASRFSSAPEGCRRIVPGYAHGQFSVDIQNDTMFFFLHRSMKKHSLLILRWLVCELCDTLQGQKGQGLRQKNEEAKKKREREREKKKKIEALLPECVSFPSRLFQCLNTVFPVSRSVAHERPRLEIVHKVTHTLTCSHVCHYAFPWQLKMADARLMFCVLLVVLIAAPNNRRRSFFRFQEAERPTGGSPKIALDPLCLKKATVFFFLSCYWKTHMFRHWSSKKLLGQTCTASLVVRKDLGNIFESWSFFAVSSPTVGSSRGGRS